MADIDATWISWNNAHPRHLFRSEQASPPDNFSLASGIGRQRFGYSWP